MKSTCQYCDANKTQPINQMLVKNDCHLYSGDICIKGHASGFGAIVNVSLRRSEAEFVGHFKYNAINGQGIMYSFNNDHRHKLFEGEFLDNKLHGVVKEYNKHE